MRLHLLLLSIIISTLISAQKQDITVPQENQKRLSLGVNFSTDNCFSTIELNNNTDANVYYVNKLKELQKHKIGYSLSICLNYQILNHFFVEIGVQYSNKGHAYAWNLDDLEPFDPFYDRRGLFYPLGENKTLVHNDNYLDVPIRVLYRNGNKKIKFISSIGLTTNYRFNHNIIYRYTDDDNNRNTLFKRNYNTLNKRNFTTTISAGFQYQHRKNFIINVEPTYRHGLYQTEFEPYRGYNIFLHSVGLNIGYYYRIS